VREGLHDLPSGRVGDLVRRGLAHVLLR
jgi:hypothetical protein